MDFLVLFVGYMLTAMVGMLCLLYADTIALHLPSCLTSAVSRIKLILNYAISTFMPTSLCHAVLFVYDYIFMCRNALFVYLYILLIIIGHLIFGLGCLPYLYTVYPSSNHVFWPMLFLVTNTLLFITCCVADPGIINNIQHKKWNKIFTYDGNLYSNGFTCSSCKWLRLARSKHCRFVDRCVFKYDHYCAWINNAVAALNHRYFILLLTSICVMCANGARQFLQALQAMTAVYKLWDARYVDGAGVAQPMDYSTLIQTLFMRHPYTVFVCVALCFILPIMLLFTVYHFYLATTNQTTNERYKKYYMKLDKKVTDIANIYNNGLLLNLMHTFYPAMYLQASPHKHFKSK